MWQRLPGAIPNRDPLRGRPLCARSPRSGQGRSREPRVPLNAFARAHNPKVAGSNPAPAITKRPAKAGLFRGRFPIPMPLGRSEHDADPELGGGDRLDHGLPAPCAAELPVPSSTGSQSEAHPLTTRRSRRPFVVTPVVAALAASGDAAAGGTQKPRRSGASQCAQGDSNSHGLYRPQGPQPCAAPVRSVRRRPACPHRPPSWTVRTHRTERSLSRMLSRAGVPRQGAFS